jgi:hypothetical protein
MRQRRDSEMSKLCEYCLPGLLVEDHSIPVPLDWRGTSPAELAGVSVDDMTLLARESANESPDSAFAGKSISLFYRIVRSPEKGSEHLPLIVYLQGGPGGAEPRPLNPYTDGWMAEAIKHFASSFPTSEDAAAPPVSRALSSIASVQRPRPKGQTLHVVRQTISSASLLTPSSVTSNI